MCEKLFISDLYPCECCAVQNSYDRAIKKIKEGEIDPVKVVNLNGEYLVTNGCNRVKATKDLGIDKVLVKWRHIPKQEMRSFEDALNLHRKYKGFNNYDIVKDEDERKKRTNEQKKDLFGINFKNLKDKLNNISESSHGTEKK